MKFVILVIPLFFLLISIPHSHGQDDEGEGTGDTEAPPADGDATTESGGGGGDPTDPPPSGDVTTEAGGGGTSDAPPSGDEMTTCGGVQTASSGTISYKLGKLFDNNERCTWIIYAADAANITFTLEDNGLIQKIEDTIKIGFFTNPYEYNNMRNYKEVVLSPFTVNKTATADAPLAFVRFFSDTKIRGLGFKITWVAGPSNPGNVTFKYENRFIAADSGAIKFTSSTPADRAVFAIKPSVDITLALKYFNGNCMGFGMVKDTLTVYKWGRTSKQEFVIQYCNLPITSVTNWKVTSQEEILITFMTNTANVTNAFQFIWAPM